MADDASSPSDSAHTARISTPQSDELSNSGPSAPSDFLKHLPSSEHIPLADASPPTGTESADNGAALPAKPQTDSQGRTLNPRSCVTCVSDSITSLSLAS